MSEQDKPVAWKRWNIEQDGDDLLICFDFHEKGEACEYERYVPAEVAANLAAKLRALEHPAPPVADLPALTPAEAVYAFAGWLTCRDEAVTFGSTHNAVVAADLVDAFCKSQGFEPPRNDWADGIKPYPVAAATQGKE